jgi:hypothetical protein
LEEREREGLLSWFRVRVRVRIRVRVRVRVPYMHAVPPVYRETRRQDKTR